MRYRTNPKLLNPALVSFLDKVDSVIDYTNQNLREINGFLDETEELIGKTRYLRSLYETFREYPPSMN